MAGKKPGMSRRGGVYTFNSPAKVTVQTKATQRKKTAAAKAKAATKKTSKKTTKAKTTTKRPATKRASAARIMPEIHVHPNVHVHPNITVYSERETRREPEKRSGDVFAEELAKFNEAKAKKEETKLRNNIQDTLTKLEGAQEAVRRHQFLVLLHGSERFRREIGWVGNPKDIFGNDSKALAKVMNNPALKKQIQEKARKADELWKKQQLIPQYNGELARIEREHPETKNKLNYQNLWQRAGQPFEKFCDAAGLKRLGFKLNPAEIIRLPFGREYREDIMKKRHLTLVGAQRNVDKYNSMRDHYERKRKELRDAAAAYSEEKRRKTKK
ncbi:MAG: hypothetical protein ABH850_01625 [Candidatus Micrarchaeota archaeon]